MTWYNDGGAPISGLEYNYEKRIKRLKAEIVELSGGRAKIETQ